MLLAVPHLLAASVCTSLIADGGPGWLNLLVPSARNGAEATAIGPGTAVLSRAYSRLARDFPPGAGWNFLSRLPPKR